MKDSIGYIFGIWIMVMAILFQCSTSNKHLASIEASLKKIEITMTETEKGQ